MLSFILLSHYTECHYAECLYTECHYAESHYAECLYDECRSGECLGAAATAQDSLSPKYVGGILLANIRLDRKSLPGANTLAYLSTESVTFASLKAVICTIIFLWS
jgi:hypothetical protein